LHLSEFRYEVLTRPGSEHHCAGATSQLTKVAPDQSVIPEEIPRIASAESNRGWVAPNYEEPTKGQSVTVARMFAAKKQDAHCQELRDRMDQNTHSRLSENKDELLVRVAPLDGATQVYVPEALRRELLHLVHDVARAGHPGVNQM